MIVCHVFAGPLDLTLRSCNNNDNVMKMEEKSLQYGFDSCGALDLSSSTSSSAANSTKVSDEDSNSDGAEGCSKRKSEEPHDYSPRKKMKSSSEENDTPATVINKRKNIRNILTDHMLNDVTKDARAAEDQRLSRLKQRDHENEAETSDGDSDDNDDDPNNSGVHVNDTLNVANDDGHVLVNINHPPQDPDVFLAPQLSAVIKPHQIGGVRFLYDNIVESLTGFSASQGYGCILAHSMGLGKLNFIYIIMFIVKTDIYVQERRI